jgi:hypothetical protein
MNTLYKVRNIFFWLPFIIWLIAAMIWHQTDFLPLKALTVLISLCAPSAFIPLVYLSFFHDPKSPKRDPKPRGYVAHAKPAGWHRLDDDFILHSVYNVPPQ